ncbi:ferredoxin reductase [Aldersonia kunmingensis]|uniref:ferredoxin reductase n=1 Tax=Aldersonia kunmingensis TaxID=408066 RepID=UPI00083674BF|nr:ferredoxin reductase [Aldersonia kunmingensis]
MAERGALPTVSKTRALFLRAIRHLFHPLRPDDYLELINPLWTTRETRGRVERVIQEGSDAATVEIRPAHKWPGHRPGQYVRLGVIIDGVYHWRAYSLTSDPGAEDGLISVTPKLVEKGVVSPYLVERIQPGEVVRLGDVEGVFTLPDPPPAKLLFISAGSGVTPIMSMLRSLDHRDRLHDVVVIHSARTREQVIFGDALHDLDERHTGVRFLLRITSTQGRIGPADLDEVCPDWRDRDAFCSGPGELLDDLIAHWEAEGDPERLHLERFQPIIGGGDGEGGMVTFLDSEEEAHCDGDTPILVAGEKAGLKLPYGCRIGICHTCVGTLQSGRLRDLRTGEVSEPTGASVRTCVNTAEGNIEIDL